MTDKYEEFKKWFTNNKFKAKKDHTWYDPKILFTEFEQESKEKEWENEIKAVIHEALVKTTTTLVFTTRYEPTTEIFNMLKEGGYLKCQTN